MGLWLSRVALGSKFIILWPLVNTEPLKHVVLKKSTLNRLAETLLKLTKFPLPHSSGSACHIIKTHKLIISKALSLYLPKSAPSVLSSCAEHASSIQISSSKSFIKLTSFERNTTWGNSLDKATKGV